jgi:hypothetical protein
LVHYRNFDVNYGNTKGPFEKEIRKQQAEECPIYRFLPTNALGLAATDLAWNWNVITRGRGRKLWIGLDSVEGTNIIIIIIIIVLVV